MLCNDILDPEQGESSGWLGSLARDEPNKDVSEQDK
jgi:hypothetical protein